ncbi:MAG: hypothetical protein UU56_C0030G0002 [Candidatus Curtissbacteria bacterium GW2011_GWA2_41_24]|uniref:Uncharacterized protein n=1 Tax=Candidatus Curtissbacteria bacterium GW2011_GWA2_41_24 TaxID=1618411 RepID=A0A0G0VP23_9BACT|nr:MAG: hypothetical protein UU56_C0030G0002 [Candidatus Curtissbacteria bacterium GW2011_GWA2_41_24]
MTERYEFCDGKTNKVKSIRTRSRSVAGLTRHPVTVKIAGSNPVATAKANKTNLFGYLGN